DLWRLPCISEGVAIAKIEDVPRPIFIEGPVTLKIENVITGVVVNGVGRITVDASCIPHIAEACPGRQGKCLELELIANRRFGEVLVGVVEVRPAGRDAAVDLDLVLERSADGPIVRERVTQRALDDGRGEGAGGLCRRRTGGLVDCIEF